MSTILYLSNIEFGGGTVRTVGYAFCSRLMGANGVASKRRPR